MLETIRDLGLEQQIIFNKGAVMVLPPGVNKATGLQAALDELRLSPHNVVGIGDAENDHAFLDLCECSAAVANALPMLKERADIVMRADHGAGVIELVELLIASDLSEVDQRISRYDILIGTTDRGAEVRLKPHGQSVLLAGTSGGGKTTLATAILERLLAQERQLCILDPEGDYQTFEGVVTLGQPQAAPQLSEIVQALNEPRRSVVVNLLGIAQADRPAFFNSLFPRLQEMRAHTGRPHWIVIDEAHHLLPSSRKATALTLPQQIHNLLFITVHPEHVAPAVLSSVDVVIAIGKAPCRTVAEFCRIVGCAPPAIEECALEQGEAVIWHCRMQTEPLRFRCVPPETERRRHIRKYAEGELAPEKSFYFRGPDGKLNLRAQNLMLFVQLADGIDDATWSYHLRCGDYSRWFRETIGDEELAAEAEQAERADLSPQQSRAAIRAAIERRYTAPL